MRITGVVALLAVASCSSSTTLSDYYSFVAANAKTLCQHEIDCGFFDPAYQSRCNPPSDARTAFATLQVEYDPTAAPACHDAFVAAIASIGCYRGGSAASLVTALQSDACMRTVRGRVAVGGVCIFDAECVAPARCTALFTCGGTCVVPATVGAACAGGLFCSKDAYCDNTGATPTCVALGDLGAKCEFGGSQCKQGLVCVFSSGGTLGGTCGQPGTAGAACTFADDCIAGLFCDTSLAPAACAPRRAMGQSCSDPDACGERLTCVGLATQNSTGTCAPPLPKGKPCQSDDDCQSPHHCVLSVCTPPPMLGQPCTGFDCGSAGFCDASSTCRATLAVGATCDPTRNESGCPEFSPCDSASKTCKSCR
jgi:hypothetical protein